MLCFICVTCTIYSYDGSAFQRNIKEQLRLLTMSPFSPFCPCVTAVPTVSTAGKMEISNVCTSHLMQRTHRFAIQPNWTLGKEEGRLELSIETEPEDNMPVVGGDVLLWFAHPQIKMRTQKTILITSLLFLLAWNQNLKRVRRLYSERIDSPWMAKALIVALMVSTLTVHPELGRSLKHSLCRSSSQLEVKDTRSAPLDHFSAATVRVYVDT